MPIAITAPHRLNPVTEMEYNYVELNTNITFLK